MNCLYWCCPCPDLVLEATLLRYHGLLFLEDTVSQLISCFSGLALFLIPPPWCSLGLSCYTWIHCSKPPMMVCSLPLDQLRFPAMVSSVLKRSFFDEGWKKLPPLSQELQRTEGCWAGEKSLPQARAPSRLSNTNWSALKLYTYK